MNKEEFYSIGRGSLNLNGTFYYGLDYAITDFMRNLEQENQQLQNNWNELKKWLEEQSNLKGTETAYLYYGRVLYKMTELERGEE